MKKHIIQDSKNEEINKIGTTKRGIGPCYADKVSRQGFRIKEWFSMPLTDSEFQWHKKHLKPFMIDLVQYIHDNKNKRILFEGAQGTFLDIDHGTYPYVTSSNTVAGAACTGAGVGPTFIDGVLGVFKAYTTRVGEGPFETELKSPYQELSGDAEISPQERRNISDFEIGEYICAAGNEYGSTTGRKRRCGWLDLTEIKRAAILSGVTHFAMTKIDALRGLKLIKMKIGPNEWKIFEGFTEDISNIKSYANLPKNIHTILDFVENYLNVEEDFIISVGPDREQQFKYFAG